MAGIFGYIGLHRAEETTCTEKQPLTEVSRNGTALNGQQKHPEYI